VQQKDAHNNVTVIVIRIIFPSTYSYFISGVLTLSTIFLARFLFPSFVSILMNFLKETHTIRLNSKREVLFLFSFSNYDAHLNSRSYECSMLSCSLETLIKKQTI